MDPETSLSPGDEGWWELSLTERLTLAYRWYTTAGSPLAHMVGYVTSVMAMRELAE